jgi:type II secretory pathway predicted ATPase ExeA
MTIDFFSLNEDPLPPWQPPIQTTSVQQFRRWLLVTMRQPKTGYAVMAVIYGPAGIGKSVAIQAFLNSLPQRTHTGLPRAIMVSLKQKGTPKGLIKQILEALGEKVRGRELYDLIDEVIRAIRRNGLEMLIIDEADWLDEDTFELLRMVFDRTKCPVVLVGLDNILDVIKLHEKFESRVGPKIPFRAIDTAEAISTFFPNLVFSRWKFDPQSTEDIDLGLHIWRRLQPSLRRVRVVIHWANELAEAGDAPRITREHIDQAFQAIEVYKQHTVAQQRDAQHSSYEEESERRRAAKAKKGR